MPKLKLFTCAFLLILQIADAQPTVIKIEPPNWWIGMRWNTVQLMVYGSDLEGVSVLSASPNVRVVGIEKINNPSYAFINVRIDSSAKEGPYDFVLRKGNDSTTVQFPILKRETSLDRYQGFSPADVIYLITPDRFADGDTTNNFIPGMLDGYNPDKLIGRHGGDIQGILNHLDYIEDLGVTAIWINPLVENNTDISYHGYALTDFYRIDPRFGTNDLYEKLVREAHQHGLKIILDHVSNHISINHPWIKDLPTADWLNGSVEHHVRTVHNKITADDPHSDSVVKANTTDGWFEDYMPDLNQRDPLLANYLIQNTLWWIESTGLDGIREDTYSYADPKFLADWANTILTEYPNFNIVGEVWLNDPVYIAPYQRGSCLTKFNTNLPAVTDYGLFTPFMRVFGNDHANVGVIYECLTKDFLYADPQNLVTFLDNHDVTRIMSICKGDVQRFKMALTILLTMRGIPEIFYGTELGMTGEGDHGYIRANFPGGFPHDPRNAFTPAGRTPQENDIFTFTQKLFRIRKRHPALQTGKLIHYTPKDNVYVYFRMLPEETTMVVVNNSATTQTVKLTEFKQYIASAHQLKNLLDGSTINATSELSVAGNSAKVLEVTQ
jgi:glycosidase